MDYLIGRMPRLFPYLMVVLGIATARWVISLGGPMDQRNAVEKALEADGWRIGHSGQLVAKDPNGQVADVDPTRFRMTVVETLPVDNSRYDVIEVDNDGQRHLRAVNQTASEASTIAHTLANELALRTPNNPKVDIYGRGYAVYIGIYKIAQFHIEPAKGAPSASQRAVPAVQG